MLLVVGALAYILYPQLKPSNEKINAILPETASIAIQLGNPKKALSNLNSLSWYEVLDAIPLLSTLQAQVKKMDSLEMAQIVTSRISELPLWISLHSTASDDLTPLYVIESNGFEWNDASLKSILERLFNNTVSQSGQNFNGREIMVYTAGNLSLSALIEGRYLAFSESALLVEDVIRAIQEPESRLMKPDEKFGVQGDLSVIINPSRLSELNAVFFKSSGESVERNLLENNLFVSLNFREDQLKFNGRGTSKIDEEIQTVAMFAESFIPLTSNSFTWQPTKIALTGLKDLLTGDFCSIEIDRNGAEASEVFVFASSDTSKVADYLNRLSQEKLNPLDSAVYQERFINSDIRFINEPEIMASLLPENYSNTKAPFYTIIQNVLIMSEDLDALKTILNDFDNETTWGRSVEKRRLIEDMIQETQLTVVQDFEFAADPLKSKLKPKWVDFFNQNPDLISVLDIFKVQLNQTNNGVLVSGDMSFNKLQNTQPEYVDVANGPLVKANVFAEVGLVTKPYVLRNHVDASLEVVFQDVNNQIYLVSKQGEVLWKRTVAGQLKGDIHQVDFYNNKKLQYFFFTDSLIHMIDRNGNDVDGFPVKHNANLPIDGSNVIDYDNNKRYRYITKDRRGDLYLFGKEGDLLDGWNPKGIGGNLLQTPFHIRVRGRDCFVVVESTGKIHLLNRRGQEYQGFPINIGKSLSGDVSFVRGANFDQSLVAVNTVDGELIQVNLDGETIMRKQLLRASGNNDFSLVDDALKTTFSITRNDGKVLTIFDKRGNEKFSISYPNSKSIAVDQYNFRNGKEIFAIRDLKRQVLRLIDREGRFLTSDIPASAQVSILYYQNRLEYEVFVNFANQMNVYAVKPL